MASITFPNGNWVEYPFYNNYASVMDVLDECEITYVSYYDNDNEQHAVCYKLNANNELYIFGEIHELEGCLDIEKYINDIVERNAYEFKCFAK